MSIKNIKLNSFSVGILIFIETTSTHSKQTEKCFRFNGNFIFYMVEINYTSRAPVCGTFNKNSC
ncbi:hypothetical protein HNO89_003535 [Sporosarcina luteola]|nr:hypothetical protein [Sporosarcina luteola]